MSGTTFRERHPFLWGMCQTFGIFPIHQPVETVAESFYRGADSITAAIDAAYTCKTCHAHWDKHASSDLSCPAYTTKDGSIVFSDFHHYSGAHPRGEP